ncbi:FAD-dependent oxidoreductase [Actinacidiphila soli]|uniref:FAD-dependent oxidoreductase n=1 Tax=Actinacidiphila soli TaxID=2487275 RepID=UPI000FCA6D94
MELTRKQAVKAMVGAGIAVAAGLRPGVAIAASGTARGHGSVIERDVCVIGGGSSGTYTALRLQDLGKSVVLVEGKDRLGGHCETYHDPETGLTTDIGVTVFHDQPIVRDYFGRFGVPLIPAGELGGGGSGAIYADFRTGLPVDGYVPPVPTALGTYYGILQQYPYLTDGYDLPDPVPAELLLPWGAFVTQYGLGSIAQIAFSFGQGFNNIDQLPAVYVLKYFGLGVVTGILTGSFLTTEGRNNSALYEQATAHLGEDVLLSTTVRSTERDGSSGVLLRVNTPTGPRTIRAGKLVITAPPLLSNLTAFDTDARERALFSRFQHGNYYTALLELPGVPADLTVSNTGADTPWNLPPLPAVYALSPSSVPGLHDMKYGSAAPLTGPRVRANILADLRPPPGRGHPARHPAGVQDVRQPRPVRADRQCVRHRWRLLPRPVRAPGPPPHLLERGGFPGPRLHAALAVHGDAAAAYRELTAPFRYNTGAPLPCWVGAGPRRSGDEGENRRTQSRPSQPGSGGLRCLLGSRALGQRGAGQVEFGAYSLADRVSVQYGPAVRQRLDAHARRRHPQHGFGQANPAGEGLGGLADLGGAQRQRGRCGVE